jgi:hypothetical protein
MFLRPLPVLLPGLQTTSIDAIVSGRSICSLCTALRDVTLKSSDPQNRIRSGSDTLFELRRPWHRDARETRRYRNGGVGLHGSFIISWRWSLVLFLRTEFPANNIQEMNNKLVAFARDQQCHVCSSWAVRLSGACTALLSSNIQSVIGKHR